MELYYVGYDRPCAYVAFKHNIWCLAREFSRIAGSYGGGLEKLSIVIHPLSLDTICENVDFSFFLRLVLSKLICYKALINPNYQPFQSRT